MHWPSGSLAPFGATLCTFGAFQARGPGALLRPVGHSQTPSHTKIGNAGQCIQN